MLRYLSGYSTVSEKNDTLVALENKVSGSPKYVRFISWAPSVSRPNHMAIHPAVVEIFLSPKW